ncbi:hypothetical protein AS594_29515 [Streptomyces agglomeratus]|uniref:DUF3224 domain-containing protein n=1 Tax=Streptomyces agglomeratus TaxID=285458 RepID=A0A1E5PEQ4_9ACTN|nr:DUF3224 domain-containing protein [Streptomyces agglomeratus]OEJ28013.1 hypothetical protein AS594_29515 [Streptomyces agglomeratus]
MPTQATGSFTYADWVETSVAGPEEGPRLARASVTNTFSGAVEASATTCEYSIAYVSGKTGVCSGHQLFSGTVGGRRGTFAVEERATFGEDGEVHCTFEVVPGSGTGELSGLSGTGGYTARHGESAVPYTFAYDLG